MCKNTFFNGCCYVTMSEAITDGAKKRSQQAKTDKKWWSSGAAKPKGKREQETKGSEMQDNMLTFSAFF